MLGNEKRNGGYLAVLNCRSADEESPLAIGLMPLLGGAGRYIRVSSTDPVTLPLWKVAKAERKAIYVEVEQSRTKLRQGKTILQPKKLSPQSVVFRTLPAEETFRSYRLLSTRFLERKRQSIRPS
jgi:hypothetical protein